MGELVEVLQFTSPKFKVLYPEYSKGKKYLVFKGGRASTKSWSIARALIDHACTYDGLRVVCGREIMKSIADSSKKLLEDTITRAGKWGEFKTTASYIENTRTNARFTFMGLRDNPDSVKGLEGTDIFWGDEADSFSQESLDILCPTMRKRGCKVVFSYNPQLPTTPIEKLQEEKSDRTVSVFINYLEVLKYLPPEVVAEAEECREKEPEKYRWIWLGEFRSQSQKTFVPLKYVLDAWGRPVSRSTEGVVAGLDIGLFHDRSVMVVRQGLNLLYGHEWKNVDNKDLTQQVIGLCVKWGVQRLGIDAVGQGYPVYQDLRSELGEVAVPLNTGNEAKNRKKYVRMRDEMWGMEKEFLVGASLNGVGTLKDWTTDLTNIEYFYDNKGRYSIESKRSYIGRGFSSTDWADALGHSLLVRPVKDAGDFVPAGRPDGVLISRNRYGDYPGDWMGI